MFDYRNGPPPRRRASFGPIEYALIAAGLSVAIITVVQFISLRSEPVQGPTITQPASPPGK